MSGAMTKVDYTADDGAVYHTFVPSWVATLTGAGASTAAGSMPKFLQRRKRYFRITATGKEGRFTVPTVAGAMWTDAFNTAVIIPLFGAATPTTANAILMGRTGERTKNR